MEMNTSGSELSSDGFVDLLAENTKATVAKSQQSLELSKSGNAQRKPAFKSVHSQGDVDRDKAVAPRAQRKTVSIDSNGKTADGGPLYRYERQPSAHQYPRPSFSIGIDGDDVSIGTLVVEIADDERTYALIELFELTRSEENAEEYWWQETARWMKYEEDHNQVHDKWSRPHVALLSFHALTYTRKCFKQGCVLLDVAVTNYNELCKLVVTAMGEQFQFDEIRTSAVLESLKRNRVPTRIGPNTFHLKREPTSEHKKGALNHVKTQAISIFKMTHTSHDFDFADLPKGTMLTQVFAGLVPQLLKVRFALVRLQEPTVIPELSDLQTPIKFLIMVLGPGRTNVDYHEVGRALATLMSNPHFYSLATTATSREDLSKSVDAFLNDSLVVPPGEVDENRPKLTHNELVNAIATRVKEKKKKLRELQYSRQQSTGHSMVRVSTNVEELMTTPLNARESQAAVIIQQRVKKRDPLKPSGRLFGAMIEDIKDRFQHYATDFTDAFNYRVVAAIIFLYIASIANAVTFGSVLQDHTMPKDENEHEREGMGVAEMLLSQAFTGIVVALFSAQPMMIFGANGPIVVAEFTLKQLCDASPFRFTVIHFYASIWIFIFCLLVAAFEWAEKVRQLTPFTEDVFSVLISYVFFYEVVNFLKQVHKYNHIEHTLEDYCVSSDNKYSFLNFTSTTAHLCTPSAYSNPDAFAITIVLLVGTFICAWIMRQLRTSKLFGRVMRHILSDSAIIISVLLMTMLKYVFLNSSYVKHVDMHAITSTFSTVNKTFTVLRHVSEIGEDLSAPTFFLAAVPAFLIFVLLFAETQGVQLMLLEKNRGLVKGSGGLHWDLLLIGVVTLLLGIMHWPWMCAAVVLSLGHAESLAVMRRQRPGEPMIVSAVVEQRVTALAVAILTGATTFLQRVLEYLPIAPLYGVLFYFGVINLTGGRFLRRVLLIFTPEKFWPITNAVQEVRAYRMHMFTCVQIVIFVLACIVKTYKHTALFFPLTIILTVGVRNSLLPRIFTHKELHALDGHDDHYDKTDVQGYFDMINAHL